MNFRLVLAAGDISSSPVLAKGFRGKAAKETYCCVKEVILTGSLAKPLGVAVATIPGELSKRVVYNTVGQIGENVLGYMSGIGFMRYLYKVLQPSKVKATARLAYNIGCLPLTLYYVFTTIINPKSINLIADSFNKIATVASLN